MNLEKEGEFTESRFGQQEGAQRVGRNKIQKVTKNPLWVMNLFIISIVMIGVNRGQNSTK